LNGFTASGIAELELERADLKLRFRRFPGQNDSAPIASSQTKIHAQTSALSYSEPQAAATAPQAESPKADSSSSSEIVSSPLVATFYRASGADSPPFAEVGKKIKAGQVLCILEAMKNMNELQTDFDCEILRILPENGSLVEFGQPLFEVRRV
jgi:acetyl-CoA carboxylase biotin carboxyl carrier protein